MFAFLGLVAGFAAVGPISALDEISVATAPPVVVKSVPPAGSTDVDPGLTEIAVTFSKDMADRNWSWVTYSRETFPDRNGEPSYREDHRTAVLPVKLEPGRTYAIWVNTAKFGNFKDVDGRSAVPYFLVFETKEAE